ncbi:MAG: hypothetical protein H6Q12_83 [Bacteroidetes bacterium]|nr:hypothetical protein [Bacteroidota bacterium]
MTNELDKQYNNMTITAKTRKILWAKSGNRCSICHKDLVDKISEEGNFIVGEECHIISSEPNGPRHKPNITNYDTYDNLILLCRNHHKEIDSNIITYTQELLYYIKTTHKNWVKETLDTASNKEKGPKPRFLNRVTSGKELSIILNGTYGSYTDYDDSIGEDEVEYIAGTLQELSDYIDIYGDLEPYDKIKTDFQLNKLIKDIEEHGFYLFGDRHTEKWKFMNGNIEVCPVCTLVIKKQDDQEIIRFESK